MCQLSESRLGSRLQDLRAGVSYIRVSSRIAAVTRVSTVFACDSRMSVCFLTRATCKNVRQILKPRATAQPPLPNSRQLTEWRLGLWDDAFLAASHPQHIAARRGDGGLFWAAATAIVANGSRCCVCVCEPARCPAASLTRAARTGRGGQRRSRQRTWAVQGRR